MPQIQHPGSKESWTVAHKDQNDDAPVPNIDEDWDGEQVILEI